MRLRSYLVSLSLATLLPLAVFAGVVGYLLVEEQRETFRRGAEERTLALLTAVDAELRGSIDTIQALSLTASLAEGDLVYFRESARRVLASQPDWINIDLALPDGQRVMDLLAAGDAPLPPIQRVEKSFDLVLQTRAPVIGDLAMGPVSKRWSYAVRTPVVQEGAVKYVVSAVIEPDAISRLVGGQNLPPGWVGVVLDANNRIVARTVEPGKNRGQLASQSLREALARAPSGWFHGSTIEGTEVYTPYRKSATSGWTFAMGIPASAMDATAWRAYGLLGAGLLGALVLALALARIFGQRVTAPIASLAHATEAIGRGERIAVPQTAAIEEVGLFARTLQACVDAMRDREEALRQAEERMRSVVDNVVDGIITIDERGVVQTFNRAAERIFGYSAAEVVGQNVRMLMPEPYRREHDGYLASYVRTGQAKIIGKGREVEGRRKDGSSFPLDLAVSVFHIGSQRYFTGIVRDITERKRAEEALREADRAKDEFLAMLSHELRNPLAALTSAAHALNVIDPSSDDSVRARAIVERQTRHMTRLVGDLLDMSRVTLGKLTLQRSPCNAGDAVASVVEVWRASGRLASHKVEVDAGAVWVDGDRARIEQIAANLLDNALKFSPAGTTVTISVRREGGDAVLRVADQGIGLEARDLERVFDLFTQAGRAEHAESGLGIGLALVKQLAVLHGGSATASSEGRGRGAVFSVRLPAIARPANRVSAAPEGISGARSILIVEDNDDARQMLAAILAHGGHRVRSASDGRTGLALAAAAPPDLALIDVSLPDMDGYELARRLRAFPAAQRMGLVAVTGFGQADDRRRALAAGFDEHLVKPVTPERLAQVIAELR
jgi:PAS domain S-box-containing protein